MYQNWKKMNGQQTFQMKNEKNIIIKLCYMRWNIEPILIRMNVVFLHWIAWIFCKNYCSEQNSWNVTISNVCSICIYILCNMYNNNKYKRFNEQRIAMNFYYYHYSITFRDCNSWINIISLFLFPNLSR